MNIGFTAAVLTLPRLVRDSSSPFTLHDSSAVTRSLDALSTLSLGTVQLGMPYGRARPSRPLAAESVGAILDAATAGGITCFDTARSYGAAEERLGTWLSGATAKPIIISKLPPVQHTSGDEIKAYVRAQLDTSLRSLKADRLDGYLVHRGDDLLIPDVEAALHDARDAGHVGAVGLSVYDPDQLEAVLARCQPDIVQLPLSLVDRRFETMGLIEHCAERGITVVARSAFLQGALLLDPAKLPAHLAPLRSSLEHLGAICADSGCRLIDLLLRAVLQTAGIASLVVGVTGLGELMECLIAWQSPPSSEVVEAAIASSGGMPHGVLDPRTWPD